MLQTKFYDTFRFKSEKEAENKNEIYRVKYNKDRIVITDPDGKIGIIGMIYRPKVGLDVVDDENLHKWLSNDMAKRSIESSNT